MRIIRSFRDYYDDVGSYDNEGIIWRRKSFSATFPKIALGEKRLETVVKQLRSATDEETIPFDLTEKQQLFLVNAFQEAPAPADYIVKIEQNKWARRRPPFSVSLLGYCGKLFYLLIDIDEVTSKDVPTFSSFEEILQRYKNTKTLNKFSKSFASLFSKKLSLQEWNHKYQNHPALNEIFFALKVPLFIISSVHEVNPVSFPWDAVFITNPRLSFYRLQRLFSPNDAYQDIDYFINNFLTNIQDIGFERTDELIRDSKGFDNWSFRQKGPKPRKRKE